MVDALYKQLYFNGKASGDFGLYISGSGTFNAPVRDVEEISIPGRNGNFIIDHGRFENIEVTYHASLAENDPNRFRLQMMLIRQWLCSPGHYVTLTDDYDPAYYRKAVYKGGLDVDAIKLSAGEFDLVFTCMPQRFSVYGDQEHEIAHSGDGLGNEYIIGGAPVPTIRTQGHGTLDIITAQGKTYEIVIEGSVLGHVILAGAGARQHSATPNDKIVAIHFTEATTNPGDELNLGDVKFAWDFSSAYKDAPRVVSVTGSSDPFRLVSQSGTVEFSTGDLTFEIGTESTHSNSATLTLDTNGAASTMQISYSVRYDGDGRIWLTMSGGVSPYCAPRVSWGELTAESTLSNTGDIYIDCETGACWSEIDGEKVDMSNIVQLPVNLPRLSSGGMELTHFTFSSTISHVYITPHWWAI